MNGYNECQVTYRQKCKERIQRQLAITGRDTTDEEVEEMIESGNPQIFTQGVRPQSDYLLIHEAMSIK